MIRLLSLLGSSFTLLTVVGLTGCSTLGVYKIDLPQGTPITQSEAQKIQVGMSKQQVIYLLGSPAFTDTLKPNRWDYIYDYTPGTYGKRDGKQTISNASQHLAVYFDGQDKVTLLEGIETLPQ